MGGGGSCSLFGRAAGHRALHAIGFVRAADPVDGVIDAGMKNRKRPGGDGRRRLPPPNRIQCRGIPVRHDISVSRGRETQRDEEQDDGSCSHHVFSCLRSYKHLRALQYHSPQTLVKRAETLIAVNQHAMGRAFRMHRYGKWIDDWNVTHSPTSSGKSGSSRRI